MTQTSERVASYGVKQKACGKNLRLRLLLLAIYFIFCATWCIIFTAVLKMPQLIAILPLFLLIIVPPTWRRVSCEREYSVETGHFIVENLYSFSRRKELIRIEIRLAKSIAPYQAPLHGTRVLDYRGDAASPDSYYILFEKDGKPCAVLFEATEKIVRALRRHNSAAVMSDTLRH